MTRRKHSVVNSAPVSYTRSLFTAAINFFNNILECLSLPPLSNICGEVKEPTPRVESCGVLPSGRLQSCHYTKVNLAVINTLTIETNNGRKNVYSGGHSGLII